MEPAIFLPWKDQWCTERKSLENFRKKKSFRKKKKSFRIFTEGVAVTAQRLKLSLLVPLLRKLLLNWFCQGTACSKVYIYSGASVT